MHVAVFAHPDFTSSTSMPIFARMIIDGMRTRGIDVVPLQPIPFFSRLPSPLKAKKWLGYLDQFILFPLLAKWKTRSLPSDCLYIFTDQALGPWIPGFSKRPHVVHCHDLLALRSSLGEIPMNPISTTGRIYQNWIRRGFNSGKSFICVSGRSKTELIRFLDDPTGARIEVVLNGLNHPFSPMPAEVADSLVVEAGLAFPSNGFLLHIGGNQWYKNRHGVIAIYGEYSRRCKDPLPLVMIGAPPDARMVSELGKVPAGGKVVTMIRPPVDVVQAAYSRASAMLFPSLAEGFGWPIIEAMACGCPVLTTNDAPMTEAGGDAATYLPVLAGDPAAWANECSVILETVLARSDEERRWVREIGLKHVELFDGEKVMDRYLEIYRQTLESFSK